MRKLNEWVLVAIAGAAVLAMSACATKGEAPDDMSAADHRAAAAKHKSESAKHEAQYDPEAVVIDPSTGSDGGIGEFDFDFGPEIYNPTERHHTESAAHAAEAKRHLAAAQSLESFEEDECHAFPAKTRVICPLLGQVSSTENIDDGVHIHFAPGVNAKAAAAHVRCHIAYGRKVGREEMPHCPLYVKGVKETTLKDGSITLTVDDSASVSELQHKTASHVGAK